MSKKALLSLLLVGVLAFGAGLGTFAWFTSTITSGNNTFKTGTLEIGIGQKYSGSRDMEFSNLYPGSAPQARTIRVKNNGSIDLDFKVSSQYADGNGALYNILELEIKDEEDTLYRGQLSALKNYGVRKKDALSLEKGEHKDLTFIVKMPEYAGNSFNIGDMSTVVKFVFDAKQHNAKNWGEASANDVAFVDPSQNYLKEFSPGKIDLGFKIDKTLSEYNIKKVIVTLYNKKGDVIKAYETKVNIGKEFQNEYHLSRAVYIDEEDEFWSIGKWYGGNAQQPVKAVFQLIDVNDNIYINTVDYTTENF